MNSTNNLTLINRQSKTVFMGLMLFIFVFPSMAVDPRVEQKVTTDLALLASFNNLSQVIENRGDDDFVTIGGDVSCDYFAAITSIQEVIDTGIAEIRLASNGAYQENILIHNQDIVIRGGFATCVEAQANLRSPYELAEIDGSSMATSVLRVTGTDARHVVRIENLRLSSGTSVGPEFGGGVSLAEADVEFQMASVILDQNTGSAGAGMMIDTGIGANYTDVDVFGKNVYFYVNQSNGVGGGIYCLGSANVAFMGSSQVVGNTASSRGGGIFMRSGCQISMYTEDTEDSLLTRGGIFNNTGQEGGGVHMLSGADLFLFGQEMCVGLSCMGSAGFPVYIEANVTSGESEHGGGVYMDGNGSAPFFYANGLILEDNTASGNGGGAYIQGSSEVIIERQTGGCWNKERCNLIINNRPGTTLGFGGAFYVDGGTLEIGQSFVEENRADFGTALYAVGESAQVTIQGSVFDDNGDEGADDFSDFYVVGASLGASVDVRHSNFVQNDAINSVFDIDPALDSSLVLLSSIVFDASSGNVLGGASGPYFIDCVLAHEDSSFTGSNVLVGNPLFYNGPGGDYHLNSASPAIDMCQEIPMIHLRDMDNELRGWDDPENNNGAGSFDAGADESYYNDVIFKDGFDPMGLM